MRIHVVHEEEESITAVSVEPIESDFVYGRGVLIKISGPDASAREIEPHSTDDVVDNQLRRRLFGAG
jgi:hypothetical protein